VFVQDDCGAYRPRNIQMNSASGARKVKKARPPRLCRFYSGA
jgi:hypothetical protein